MKDNTNPDIKKILVGNKCDLTDHIDVVKEEEVKNIMDELDIDFYFKTSAKTGENVEKLFIEASKMLYKDYISFKNIQKKKEKINEISNKIKLKVKEENKMTNKKCGC